MLTTYPDIYAAQRHGAKFEDGILTELPVSVEGAVAA